MDENVDSVGALLSAHAAGAADVVNIKISKFGGLTKAKRAVDLCTEAGMAMTIEDSWGGEPGNCNLCSVLLYARLIFVLRIFGSKTSARPKDDTERN